MNFRNHDLMPDEGIPFQYDPFNRQLFANKLNEIITTTSGITIFLHSPWGHGKTTFIRQWQQSLLNDKKSQIAILDAFSKDFIDDPFVLFMAEIKELIDSVVSDEKDEDSKELTKKITDSWKTAKHYGAKIAIGAGKQTLKRYVGDIFEDDVAKDITSETIDQVEEYLESRVKDLSKEVDSITAFKNHLAEVADSFKKKNNGYPLTIVIDELDRCRPDFALALLEQMKHLFDAKGVCFVIATDKDKLSQHVAHAYGLKSNDLGYITKFGDIFCSLPVKPFGEYESWDGYAKFIDLWCGILTGSTADSYHSEFRTTLTTLVTDNQSSMRNVILMLKKAYFKMELRSLRRNPASPTTLAVIAFMSVEHPDELHTVLHHQESADDQRRWQRLLHVSKIDDEEHFTNVRREIRTIINFIFGAQAFSDEDLAKDKNWVKLHKQLTRELIEDFEYLIKLEA